MVRHALSVMTSGYFSVCVWLCDWSSSLVLQDSSSQQAGALVELRQSLLAHGVCLELKYSSYIHDREIRYSQTTEMSTTVSIYTPNVFNQNTLVQST